MREGPRGLKARETPSSRRSLVPSSPHSNRPGEPSRGRTGPQQTVCRSWSRTITASSVDQGNYSRDGGEGGEGGLFTAVSGCYSQDISKLCGRTSECSYTCILHSTLRQDSSFCIVAMLGGWSYRGAMCTSTLGFGRDMFPTINLGLS